MMDLLELRLKRRGEEPDRIADEAGMPLAGARGDLRAAWVGMNNRI